MENLLYTIITAVSLSVSCTVVDAQSKFVNTIGMEFVLIAPGSMIVGEFKPPYPVPEDTVKGADRPLVMAMGDGRSYNRREFDNARKMALADMRTGFKVDIKKSFYIGVFEVTQGQWRKVMGNNPSTFQGQSDNFPVENVSWEEAQQFITALNRLEKKKKYRLPTEFEWEYAARGGNVGDIPWEAIVSSANLNKTTTQRVGQLQPNAYGLYDVLGNVWEWVSDYYNEKMFADPVPKRSGSVHVLKGASFVGDVKNATYMTHAGGPGNGWDVGFRVLMEP